jgi:hypothetical protein
MAAVQEKFLDALETIKGAQAAPAYNFHDLAGDALGKLRRGLLAHDGRAPDVRHTDALDVVDFLLKCSEKKTRKSQVIECLGMMVVTSSWATAINSSSDIQNGVEVLLRGNQPLLDALANPSSEPEDSFEDESEELAKRLKKLTPEDLDSVAKNLKSAHDDMVAAEWTYHGNIDKAISGFRCLYNATVKMDGTTIELRLSKVDDCVFATFRSDWQNLVCLLKSLHDARKSLRSQVTYVVEKMSVLSSNFLAAIQESSTLPWQCSNPQSPDVSDDEMKCIGSLKSTGSNPVANDDVKLVGSMKATRCIPVGNNEVGSMKVSRSTGVVNDEVKLVASTKSAKSDPVVNEVTPVFIKIDTCRTNKKGAKITHNNGFEFHQFSDDASQSNTRLHIDVMTHIMDLVLNHQTTKQVVTVQIDKAARLPHILADIHYFYGTRGLVVPQLISM